MSAKVPKTQFEAETSRSAAPDNFEILSAFEMQPHDAGTPPMTAKLFMSPEFTNPEGADADRGKTRDYYVVLDYPAGVENTVVKMGDCPTVHGSRMFRKFVESVAEDKGYTMQSVDILDYLED